MQALIVVPGDMCAPVEGKQEPKQKGGRRRGRLAGMGGDAMYGEVPLMEPKKIENLDLDDSPEMPRRGLVTVGAKAAAKPQNLPVADPTAKFWEIIKDIGWRAPSEGRVSKQTVTAKIEALTPNERKAFSDKYKEFFDDLSGKFSRDGLFQRHGGLRRGEAESIISHFIGLGQDVYGNVLVETQFADIILGDKDYASLNECLPADIQM